MVVVKSASTSSLRHNKFRHVSWDANVKGALEDMKFVDIASV